MEEPNMEIVKFETEDNIVTLSGDPHPSGEQCEGPDAPMNNCGDFMM